jgi:hypothetical protein
MVTSLTPCFLATSATGVWSASRRILTICSSVNRVFFIAPPLPVGAIFLSFSWYGKCQAGHMARNTTSHVINIEYTVWVDS